MKRALVPGSFDPITLGHISLIKRAAELFDEVVVCVMQNAEKTYLFTLDERCALARDAVSGIENARADKWDGMLWKYAANNGVCAVVKGIRGGADLEYELAQAGFNAGKGVETVFLPAEKGLEGLSLTYVRSLAAKGEDISAFVTKKTASALRKKYKNLLEDKK